MAREKTKGRSTVYHSITTKEKRERINPENLMLEDDYIEYLVSIDRAPTTIKQYRSNLFIFWCWNLEYNNNKLFTKLTKRELTKFQTHALQEWKWSSSRIRMVKSTLNSLSKYIVDVLDEEYKGFKPIIDKVENPPIQTVRVKTVFTQEDLQELLDELVRRERYMQACMLSLAMNSGRRRTELIEFKTYYFKDEYTICNGAFYKSPEKIRTKGRGTNGKMLNVYVLKKPFDPYLKLWMDERTKLGIKSTWLFPEQKKGKWLNQPISDSKMGSWASVFKRMIGKNFYWHSVRHRFVTYLLENGVPENVIQDLIGWDSADMVKVYDDSPAEAKFEKYFDANGVKTRNVSASSLKRL